MKILQVNKFFDYRGGPEFYIPDLMARLTARGHEVHVFATRSDKDRPTPDRDYFVTRYAYDRREGPWRDAIKAVNFIWNREAKQSLARMIADVKPDVIHVHNAYHHLSSSVLHAIRESGVPCVQTLHDYKLACPNYMMFTQGAVCERCKGGHYCQAVKHHCLFPGTLPNMLGAFEMAMTKFFQSYENTVGTFIAPSKFLMDKMIEWGEPPGKFAHLPNPIEVTDTNNPADVVERDSDSYVFVGRLYANKGVETAVRAAARAGVKLDVVGDGPERQRLERLASELSPDRIAFHGFQTGEALEKIRRRARAVVVPSIWYENGPFVILEAMGLGLPVMGSDIGGIPEMVQHNVTGMLVKPGSVDDWIQAFKNMETKSPDQRRAMGQAGRLAVRQGWNWETHLKKLEDVYNGVCM